MPKDALGNKLEKGDLVRVSLPESGTVGKIVQIDPPGVITAPGAAPGSSGLRMEGRILIISEVFIGYRDDNGALGPVLKLTKPPEERNKPN